MISCSLESKFNSEIPRIGKATRSQQLYCTVFESTVNELLLLEKTNVDTLSPFNLSSAYLIDLNSTQPRIPRFSAFICSTQVGVDVLSLVATKHTNLRKLSLAYISIVQSSRAEFRCSLTRHIFLKSISYSASTKTNQDPSMNGFSRIFLQF